MNVDFHAHDAHVYVDASEDSRTAALALRPLVEGLGVEGVTLGRVNEGPRGPHLRPS